MSDVIQNRILKTEPIKWRELKWIQGELKSISKESFQKLKQSLKNNSFIQPFNVWQNGELWCLDGHHRLKAMQDLEKDGVSIPELLPANFINCKDKKEAKKLVLIYSSIYARTSEDSLYSFINETGLNFADLKLEIDLPEINLNRFENNKFPSEIKDAEPQIDRAAELNKKWKVKTGDLFRIGEHRLLCGDSTKKDDFAVLFNGGGYAVLTDPPYNIGFKYASTNDRKTKEEYSLFCDRWFNVIVKEALSAIITPGPRNERYYPEPRDKGIWVKPNATAGATCFHLRLAEPILFYGKFDKKRDTDVFNYSSGFTKELKEARRANGVLDKHPPAKSMPLWIELMNMFEERNVVDGFGGNGTTMIAGQNVGKWTFLMEKDSDYCAVILDRMKTAFPEIKIEKLN